MKRYVTQVLFAMFFVFGGISCSAMQTTETLPLSSTFTLSPTETKTIMPVTDTPTVEKENTPTETPKPIATSLVKPSPSQAPFNNRDFPESESSLPTTSPTKTAIPTTEAQATNEAFGPLCNGRASDSTVSPDGQWITVECVGTLDNPNTHLRIVSMDRTKDWKIYFGDYAKGSQYDHKDTIVPYRWTKDGRFLFAVSPTKFEGCCWMGGYGLLVRLNLETGDQVAILNVIDTRDSLGIPAINFAISDDDRYLIYVPPLSEDRLIVQDLLTWEAKEITIEFQNEIDAFYVLLSPDLDKIVLTLFQFNDDEYVYQVDAIGLIDLTTGEQKKLISNLDKPLYPFQWVDADHVLLTTTGRHQWNNLPPENEFWLLNIQTAELTKVENP